MNGALMLGDISEPRIWCLASDGSYYEFDQVPARCLPLLRKDLDLGVIPGDHDGTREFAEFCKEVLSLSDDQIIYGDNSFFADSPGSATSSLSSAISDGMNALSRVQNPLLRESSGGINGSPVKSPSMAPKSPPWNLIPFKRTTELHMLEAKMHGRINVLSETQEWLESNANGGIIHRHVKSMDKPSRLEELGVNIKTPRGFVCSNEQDLLVAYRILSNDNPDIKVIIKPIGSSGHGTFVPSSAEELRFYDFPYGDVVLQENMADEGDGALLSPSVQFFGSRILPGKLCERIIMGSTTYGLRSCTADGALADTISAQAVQLLDALKPLGAGSLGFTSYEGQPVLTDIHMQAGIEHFTKLFHEMYGNGKAFASWSFCPNPTLDIWTLWTRLCDKDIGFVPGTSSMGIFPLLFLKGSTATLIALADTEAEVTELRLKADLLVRLIEDLPKMESVALTESRNRIWCQSPRIEYRLQTQRYNLPSRCIGLLRPGRDVIILPGGHEPTKEFWEFAKDILGFDDDQAIFTSGDSFNLDSDMDDVVLSKLRSLIQASDKQWTFVPYMVTAQFEAWATKMSDLNLAVFGEELEWVNTFGSKGILHRHIQSLETPSIIEVIDPTIRVAKGYGCSTVDDLVEAWRLLDCKQVVVKPVFGAAGEGILFLNSVEQLRMYDFPMGDVCLEEFLDLDKSSDGLVLSPAMHYNEGVLLGKDLVDQIMVGTAYMGWRKSEVPKAFQKTADRYMQTFIQYIKPKGPGGVDFLSVKGLPILSDINTGRFNGAHFPKLFVTTHAPGSAFYCWKAAPSAVVDVYGYWNKLVAAGIAFIPGKSSEGVFPLLYLRGMSGLYVAVASTNSRAEALYRQGDSMLERFNKTALVQPSPHLVPRPSFFKKADITGKSAIKIWVGSSIVEMRHPQLRIDSTCRPVCLIRPGKDVVVLPGGQENVYDWWEFVKEVLRLNANQVIWTSNKDALCLDDAIDDDVVSNIKDFIETKADGEQMVIVPRAVSTNFQRWTGKIDVSTVKVFGEDSDWISKWGRKNGLFRQAATPEEPSRMEKLLEKRCLIRRGYICHNHDELAAAFGFLDVGKEKAWICPVDCHEGRFSKTVSSIEEVKLYHFSDGPVFLSKVMKLDKAQDGLPITISVTYMKGAIFGQGFNDTVYLGNRKQGMRMTVTAPEFQAEVTKLTGEILREMKPQGPGSLDFGMVNGKPILMDMETNNMTTMHYAKLFSETYAPGKVICCWHSHPPTDTDVWTFWSRMLERGLAFDPNSKKSKAGVFPLLFLKASSTTGHNGQATFIAIADTDAEAHELKERAEDALREQAPTVMRVESDALDDVRRRIYFMAASQHDPGFKRKYQVASRMIPCMRPGLDLIILPADNKSIAEYWDFAQMTFDFDYSQALFTNWNPEDGLDEATLTQLKAQIVGSPEDKWTLVPYVMTPGIERFAAALAEFGVVVFGEDLAWTSQYGSKSILHRHIQTKDKPSVVEAIIDPGIAVPRGFVCSTMQDLMNAWTELNLNECIVKPVVVGNGDGVIEIKDIDQLALYDFPYGDAILEEKLHMDCAVDGLVLASSVAYMGNRLIGPHKGIVDQIMVGNACMGFRKSHSSGIFQKRALRIAATILAKLRPNGPGRIEFVSVDGAPVLMSFAGGRLTNGHISKMFYDMYGKGKSFYYWERKPGDDIDPMGFWRRLKNAGTHFTPGGNSGGIFPLQYLRGMSGMFIALGKDENECMVLHDKLASLLKPTIPLLPQIKQQMQSRYELTLIKNAEAIFAPDHVNARHILVGGTQVVGLLDDDGAKAVELLSADISTRIIDASGCIITPGFVDVHVHITGGGGELGPASRTPEAKVNELIEGGLTTVVGVLGTDCISRSLENLVVKCRALNDEGITAFMWTGAYRLPCPTVTGTIRRDIVLIEQCIGAGEIAISDHRGTQPDINVLSDAAADCRVGGILSGKAGVMYCHIGTGSTLLGPLWSVVKQTQVPIQTFLPTHMERSEALIEDGAKWVKEGGYVDFTCRTLKARLALKKFDQEGVPMDRVMVSSDSYGSLPTFDEEGNLVKYTYGNTKAFLQFLFKMYFQEMWPMEKILPLITSNPANFLKLKGKGKIEVGCDADILLLDKNTLKLKSVIAKGRIVMTKNWTHQGMFGLSTPAPTQRVPSSAEKLANTRKWLASGCEDPNCC